MANLKLGRNNIASIDYDGAEYYLSLFFIRSGFNDGFAPSRLGLKYFILAIFDDFLATCTSSVDLVPLTGTAENIPCRLSGELTSTEATMPDVRFLNEILINEILTMVFCFRSSC